MYPISQKITEGNGNSQAGRDVITNNFISPPTHAIPFYENDIAQVIEAFNNYTSESSIGENSDEKYENEFQLIDKQQKNRLNSLSPQYFKIMCETYLPYFYKIDSFLRDPKNSKMELNYRRTAKELKFRICACRSKYSSFEEILSYIFDHVIKSSDKQLIENRDVFIVFLNYMYWNCDIGDRGEEDA